MRHTRSARALSIAALCVPTALVAQGALTTRSASCASDNGGITLPKGFCATVFADSLAGPRHLVVAPNGDVFVALRGRGGQSGTPGGVMALRDENGDGRADRQARFGNFSATEVALFDGHLYTEDTRGVLRYRLPTGALEPSGAADTVVGGLPTGGHAAKTFAIGRDGALYVNIGSRTNACQSEDRKEGSPGVDPCTELETRAGIWRFDARKLNQTQSGGQHFARGIRNSVAIAINPADNSLYAMQHGRDQLSGNWPKLFTNEKSAETPAEEMFRLQSGDDFGWPYCYFDPQLSKKALAPEFGGDGNSVGRCSTKKGNVASFPGHWAPNGLLFYTGAQLPARYRQGAFIAFHGSWNRGPLPQAGFNVVFQPMRDGKASGKYEIFADGFAPNLNVARGGGGNRRPTGLAQGPDGALYVTDDAGGRIWKIVYAGAPE